MVHEAGEEILVAWTEERFARLVEQPGGGRDEQDGSDASHGDVPRPEGVKAFA
jgi:hypothetical protein